MIGTYASAALICAASMLVGRALLSLAGRDSWSWLEPAVGFGALITVTGALARAPGHGASATLGVVLLVATAALIVWWTDYDAAGALRTDSFALPWFQAQAGWGTLASPGGRCLPSLAESIR